MNTLGDTLEGRAATREQERLEEAANVLQYALKIDGNHLLSLLNYGQVQLALGRPDLARQNWEKALRVSAPGTVERQQAETLLRQATE